MVDVNFVNSESIDFNPQLKDTIVRAFENCLMTEEVLVPVEVSIEFVSPEKIQSLNREYRNKDLVTDVLSFPIFENKEEIISLGNGPVLLGDIIINPDRARTQAIEYGHSFEREVLFLSIHSLLHLLGYDHMDVVKQREMRSREKRILTSLVKSDESG